MMYRVFLCLFCILIFSACSSNQGVDLNAVRDTINIRFANDQAPNEASVTQESLKGVTQKLVRVCIPKQDVSFFAAHVATNGQVKTFTSRAGQSVSFEGSRIVSTRGLGFDLIGKDIFFPDNGDKRVDELLLFHIRISSYYGKPL